MADCWRRCGDEKKVDSSTTHKFSSFIGCVFLFLRLEKEPDMCVYVVPESGSSRGCFALCVSFVVCVCSAWGIERHDDRTRWRARASPAQTGKLKFKNWEKAFWVLLVKTTLQRVVRRRVIRRWRHHTLTRVTRIYFTFCLYLFERDNDSR